MTEEKENAQNIIVQQENSNSDEQAMQDAIIKSNIAKVHELRGRTDGLVHIIRTAGPDSYEKVNASAKLILLRGWFQDVLEYLGEPAINLASNTKMKSFTDIDEDTDTSEGIKVQMKTVDKNGNESIVDANEVESLNHVRRDIEWISNQVAQLATITETAYETFIFQQLREAKFWLDRELFRIKQIGKQKIFQKPAPGARKLPNRLQNKAIRPDFGQGPDKGNIGQSPLIVKKTTPEQKAEGELKVDIKVENDDKAEGETNS